MKKNKAFTLIELIAVLVILAIISLIVAPLILNIIRRVKDVANKRSVDGYGRAVEYAMASYQLEHLAYPDTFDKLEIEYKGNKVECKTSRINPDYSIYLSECKVNGKLVKNDNEFDGYYHYGILKMTNQEYVDTYGKNLEDALKKYHDEHDEYPSDYTTLELPPLDKEVACDVEVYSIGKIYLTKCSVDGEEVLDESQEDGYYHYRETRNAVKYLLKRTNSKSIISYLDGNTHEMYTFEHSATEQTGALTDYRYIGNAPYNYVAFNNELWRIIGVFTVEDENGKQEQRIKIVRNEKLTNSMKWDSNNINEWSTSTLNIYLNGDYYNSLNSLSKKMIVSSKYYLGGIPNVFDEGEKLYLFERGINKINNHSLNYVGKIGLMYPSDYVFEYALGVSLECYTNPNLCIDNSGWMINNARIWLITPNTYNQFHVYLIDSSGTLNNLNGVAIANSYVRPTLYLSSSVKISSGTGKSDDPYQLSMN